MATLMTYVRTMWDVQQTVSNKLGYDLRRGSLEMRAAVLSIDATLALLIKVLVDTGVVQDAVLNGAVQQVRNMAINPLPPLPPDIPEDGSPLPPPPPITGV